MILKVNILLTLISCTRGCAMMGAIKAYGNCLISPYWCGMFQFSMKVSGFARRFQLAPAIVKLIQAFWLLDHGDFQVLAML